MEEIKPNNIYKSGSNSKIFNQDVKKLPRKTNAFLARNWSEKQALDKKLIKSMFEAGIHRGDLTQNWNPKMAPYIRGEFKGKHVINLVQTLLYLEEVCTFLEQEAFKGKKFLFVGTQTHSSVVVKKTAIRTNSFFVNEKWLGGMLTNWKTAKRLVKRLNFLLLLEKTAYIEKLSKKERNDFKKEKNKLKKYFLGLRSMRKLPGVVILASQNQEINALKECQRLKIPSITILDTNSDPTLADYFIPGNDDSYKSINFLFKFFRLAIKKGRNKRQQLKIN